MYLGTNWPDPAAARLHISSTLNGFCYKQIDDAREPIAKPEQSRVATPSSAARVYIQSASQGRQRKQLAIVHEATTDVRATHIERKSQHCVAIPSRLSGLQGLR